MKQITKRTLSRRIIQTLCLGFAFSAAAEESFLDRLVSKLGPVEAGRIILVTVGADPFKTKDSLKTSNLDEKMAEAAQGAHERSFDPRYSAFIENYRNLLSAEEQEDLGRELLAKALVSRNRLKVVQTLVEAGVNIHEPLTTEEQLKSLKERYEDPRLFNHILEHRKVVDLPIWKASQWDPEVYQYLLEQGADPAPLAKVLPDRLFDDGDEKDREKFFAQMEEIGADVGQLRRNVLTRLAASTNHWVRKKDVKDYLEKGMDLSAKNLFGEDFLMSSSRSFEYVDMAGVVEAYPEHFDLENMSHIGESIRSLVRSDRYLVKFPLSKDEVLVLGAPTGIELLNKHFPTAKQVSQEEFMGGEERLHTDLHNLRVIENCGRYEEPFDSKEAREILVYDKSRDLYTAYDYTMFYGKNDDREFSNCIEYYRSLVYEMKQLYKEAIKEQRGSVTHRHDDLIELNLDPVMVSLHFEPVDAEYLGKRNGPIVRKMDLEAEEAKATSSEH